MGWGFSRREGENVGYDDRNGQGREKEKTGRQKSREEEAGRQWVLRSRSSVILSEISISTVGEGANSIRYVSDPGVFARVRLVGCSSARFPALERRKTGVDLSTWMVWVRSCGLETYDMLDSLVRLSGLLDGHAATEIDETQNSSMSDSRRHTTMIASIEYEERTSHVRQ